MEGMRLILKEFAILMRHETVLSKIGFGPKLYKPYLFLYRRSEKSIKILEIIKFPKNITFLVHKFSFSFFSLFFLFFYYVFSSFLFSS